MKKSRYTEEQIAYALRQAEAGMPIADVCRQMGISEASFYVWRKKYAGTLMSQPEPVGPNSEFAGAETLHQ